MTTYKLTIYPNGSHGLQGHLGPIHETDDASGKDRHKAGDLIFGLDADLSVYRNDPEVYEGRRDAIEAGVQVGGIMAQDTTTTRERALAMNLACDITDELEAKFAALEAAGVFNKAEGEEYRETSGRHFDIYSGIADQYNGRRWDDKGEPIAPESDEGGDPS